MRLTKLLQWKILLSVPYFSSASVVVMKLTAFVHLRTGNILVRSD